MVVAANKFKLILLGNKDAGKSALTARFCLNLFIKKSNTVSDTYNKKFTVDSKPAMVEILDASTSDEDSYLYHQWFNEAQAALILYPVTSRKAFENLDTYWDEVERVKGFDELSKRLNIPIFLVGTKSDCSDDERKVTTMEGREKAQNWGCHFFEVSARTNKNVLELFSDVTRTLRRFQQEEDFSSSSSSSSGSSANLEKKKKAKKSWRRFLCF